MSSSPTSEPINLADAHKDPDPTGYRITHADEGGVTVGLVLWRISDGANLGTFGSRDELDAAAAADRAEHPLGSVQ